MIELVQLDLLPGGVRGHVVDVEELLQPVGPPHVELLREPVLQLLHHLGDQLVRAVAELDVALDLLRLLGVAVILDHALHHAVLQQVGRVVLNLRLVIFLCLLTEPTITQQI